MVADYAAPWLFSRFFVLVVVRFVWNKKLEKQIMDGVDPKDLGAKAEARRHTERMVEIEKVKQRRAEREAEKEAADLEREQKEREAVLEEAAEMERKEEEFLMAQEKKRVDLRIKEGRSKPIDVLSRNLSYDADFNPDVTPTTIFIGLSLREVIELGQDVRQYAEMERDDPDRLSFWSALGLVCEDEARVLQVRSRGYRCKTQTLNQNPKT